MELEESAKLVHSANERIAVDDLQLGVDMLRAVAHDLRAHG
jgi:acetylornithine deacetylase/succinyl-diaminopimelate desuccinylase-like protein